jgi:hypothetical protein
MKDLKEFLTTMLVIVVGGPLFAVVISIILLFSFHYVRQILPFETTSTKCEQLEGTN